MKRGAALVLMCGLLGAGFLGGAWVTWRALGTRQPAASRLVLYYACPMHPQYHSDHPGDCPSCGMRLEPISAGDASSSSGGAVPPGAIRVPSEKQQVIGVTTGVAERTSLSRTIRTVGRVAADENRVYRLVTTIDGWITQVFAGQTGAIVARDQVLLTFYSREFLAAQASYFFALDAADRYHASGQENANQTAFVESQIRAAAETLQGLGMDAIQASEIAKTRKAATDIALRSPTTGYIVARSVYPRQRLERGAELYRIVDVSRVWILADLFESDAQYVGPGSAARVSFPYQAQGPIAARVGDALPQFDPASRTLKLRLEADNPAYVLRPDMLVDVELDTRLPEAIAVPADAVVDSGGRQTVFVDRGRGYFEPREVETGWRFDQRVEIVKGLMPGERIALSGNFLLDSESRMAAAWVVPSVEVPPVPPRVDHDEGITEAGIPLAPRVRGMGARRPRPLILPPPMKPEAVAPASNPAAEPAPSQVPIVPTGDMAKTSLDPVCRITVDEELARSAGLVSKYQGRTYFFVSKECKAQFDQDPAAYANR